MANKLTLPRVYSMGSLPLASLITHSIATIPEQPEIPQVVSLLRSEQQLRHFLNNNSTLKLRQFAKNRVFDISDVQLMSACRPPVYGDGSFAEIHNLVLGMNHHDDIMQIKEYKKCLTSDSNVLLLNPNRNTAMALVERVWSDPMERPNIYQCIHDFRIWKDDEFTVNMLGDGNLKIAKLPRFLKDLEAYKYNLNENLDEEADILKLILETKNLNPSFISYQQFAYEQAEYLIIKTCVGSLSALFDCSNGELLKMKNLSSLLLKHIEECIRILQKSDPLLNQANYSRVTLNKERIYEVIIELLKRTKNESSILRKRVNLYSNLELQSTSGYFVKMASKHKIPASHNLLLNKLINAKFSLNKNEKYDQSFNDDIELEL